VDDPGRRGWPGNQATRQTAYRAVPGKSPGHTKLIPYGVYLGGKPPFKDSGMKISKYQKKIMEHAISGPGRNWFATSFDCKDSIEFEKLVKAGYATSEETPSWVGDDVIYRLTTEGRKALANAR